ncbi:hypothetical protein N7499_003740 [Penicillium canescens]|uniref:Uncharacterized protein n=1 Tax=Penicillium canescens TaxID=5083 RepID=A0AAD6N618_PENCN|nr:uncharacterized protein N7446_014081 [Penicillium canescens]KAJ6018464.1 hypothetical protein N7522_001928 [Penicillium canescens]KAJ6034102.1 hypothetical protein N7460_009919 [Penicillium canescens]KAJ6039333.1 hypothetical protein N7446_014081 [Penicillium canescens]KAJ6066173.1 hypothetical protein N7444_000302 [Penicillium canescens]KAJ6091026.1 hypothetical protein N7499_003740 [Penicillium canescens]
MPPSTLECLPREIIEIIYLDALEVNFARASNVIAAAVSREAVYDIFMIQALWNDPQDCIRQRYSDREFLYVDELQRKVMSCRWFNIHRFERVLPVLLALTLDAIALQEKTRFPSKEIQQRQWSAASTMDTLQSLRLHTNDGYPKRLRIIDHFAIQAEYFNPNHGPRHIIRPVRVFWFPNKALHGPWTDDKVKLLVALRRAFGKRFTRLDLRAPALRQRHLAPVISDIACLQGIEAAIRQNCRVALLYLLDIRESFPPVTTNILHQKQFPDQLLMMAVQTHAPDFDIIELLVRASLTSARSCNLVKWSIASSLRGSVTENWLLSSLQQYSARGNCNTFWKALWSTPAAEESLLEQEPWL